MKIDKPLILKLEKLAKLKLSENEREELLGDLNNILGMVDKLDKLDTTDVKPLVYLTDEPNEARADIKSHSIDREQALKNAPDKNEQFFKVPKVIDLQK